MGDESKPDTALLMHIMGMAQKGGMDSSIIKEMMGIVREQAKLNEETIERQTESMVPTPVNVPFDIQSLQLQQGPKPTNADLFDKMLEESFRTGWKADDEWECFIEHEARGGVHLTDACQSAQKIANDEEVPVRLNFNDTRCLLYPEGEWQEAVGSWENIRHREEKTRNQLKVSNYGLPTTTITTNYAKVDAEATKMIFQVLKNRAPSTEVALDTETQGHFFGSINKFLGDD